MYVCTRCNSVFRSKVKSHGRAKTRSKAKEYYPCAGLLQRAELRQGRGERFKIQLLFNSQSG